MATKQFSITYKRLQSYKVCSVIRTRLNQKPNRKKQGKMPKKKKKYIKQHPQRKKSGEGNGTPLQYSCLEKRMDGGAWKAAVHGVAERRTQLSDFTFTFHFHALEKEMATHSSVIALRIPGTGEPGGLQSMGSHRVGHD